MSGYVYLQGSEDVSRASLVMRDAAQTMSNAAANIEDTFQRQSRFMDDWLERFQNVVRESNKEQESGA